MTAGVWRAVADLAALWRTSPFVQSYAAGARAQLAQCSSRGADHITAQPFYLCMYLPTLTRSGEPARRAGPSQWLEQGARLADAYTTLIEWLRSRLDGYPFPGSPHLAPASPWTRFTVSMTVPWLIEKRRWQLQNFAQPPTISFLGIDAQAQLYAGAILGAAVASSPASAEVRERWRALTSQDRGQLAAACQVLQDARYPEPADVRGDEDFRELAWSEYILDQAVQPLKGPAQAFVKALSNADRLIRQAAVLFSQLVLFSEIRQLPQIGLVEQLEGASGWHDIRSDSYFFEPVRHFEIIGFDHPYPRGVMLVEGVTEQLPVAPPHGSVTVRGRILDDSEELAASAVPIQSAWINSHGR
ncbi:MAG: hypothetical protein ACRDOH_14990 [Streptosporangiaceae bacterium]